MTPTSDDELNPEERVRADEEDYKAAIEHTTALTGDEVKERLKRHVEDGLDWEFIEDVTNILADLADELKDHREHRNAFVIMLDKKIEVESAALRARVANLADRVDTVDEPTPSFHSIARLETRIKALEQRTSDA